MENARSARTRGGRGVRSGRVRIRGGRGGKVMPAVGPPPVLWHQPQGCPGDDPQHSIVDDIGISFMEYIPSGSPLEQPSCLKRRSMRRPVRSARTRGGRGGRSGRVRIRGGRGGKVMPAVGPPPVLWHQPQGCPGDDPQHSIVDEFMENIPSGSPLERPLRPKRRCTEKPFDQPPEPSSPVKPSPAVFLPLPGPSGTVSAMTPPPAAIESLAVPSGKVPPAPSSPDGTDPLAGTPGKESPPMASPPAGLEYFVVCKPDSIRIVARHHNRNGSETRPALTNLGSESESSSDEEGLPALPIPRAVITLISDDEDDMDPLGAGDSTTDRFYDFEWRSFPKSSMSPELRRETFSENNLGPTTIFRDAYDAFIAIWDREIMEQIAVETNRYAQSYATMLMENDLLRPNSRIKDWQDTNTDELYLYFAIVLAMGVVVKSVVTEYWCKNDVFSTPGFRAAMRLRRFELLTKCLHFNDNEKMSAQLDAVLAKIFKIQPIVTHLNRKFKSLYTPDRNLTLDEALLQWKDNEFVSNKRANIKCHELCDARSGYLWRYEMSSDRKKGVQQTDKVSDPMSAPRPSLVLKLVQGLEHKGYTVWMDKYYSSPALARKLKKLGFDCVGTLSTYREFVLEELYSLKKGDMQPGQMAGFTSGDVDLLVWRDKTRVATISTYHGNAVSVVNGVAKPMSFCDYNLQLRKIDKKNQILAMFPIERKRATVWYKKMFRRFLNVSTYNAYVLTKHPNRNYTQRDFRMSLITRLIEKHSARAVVLPPECLDKVFEAKTHHPLLYPVQGRSGRLRRKCTICKESATSYCVGCDKTVCLDPCFAKLHR